ncbi:hypothetical protein DFH09DRAFT_1076764 [Mycena vulgaris]|nr:hypothetical protein DFH09DRAFT_1076764 [Mycena vulgaris]
MCSALVRNFAEFSFVRALLGVLEGGVHPGMAYFLSKFYRCQELTYSSPQWVSSSLQATLAQPLAVLLHQRFSRLTSAHSVLAENLAQHICKLPFYKLLPDPFYLPQLIEGLITTVVAICVFFLMINSPMQARWLTEDNKQGSSLKKITTVGTRNQDLLGCFIHISRRKGGSTVRLKDITRTRNIIYLRSSSKTVNLVMEKHLIHTRTQRRHSLMISVQIWGNSRRAENICLWTWLIAIGFLFISTLSSRWFRRYLIAAVVQIITPYISMRMDTRGPFMAALVGVGIIGYAIFVGCKSLHARYAACFLMAAGAFPFGAFSPGLVAVSTGPDTTRSRSRHSFVHWISRGHHRELFAPPPPSLPPIPCQSTWTYVNADAPDYCKENTLNLAGMVIVLVLTVVNMIYMKWENAQRAHGTGDEGLQGSRSCLHAKFKIILILKLDLGHLRLLGPGCMITGVIRACVDESELSTMCGYDLHRNSGGIIVPKEKPEIQKGHNDGYGASLDCVVNQLRDQAVGILPWASFSILEGQEAHNYNHGDGNNDIAENASKEPKLNALECVGSRRRSALQSWNMYTANPPCKKNLDGSRDQGGGHWDSDVLTKTDLQSEYSKQSPVKLRSQELEIVNSRGNSPHWLYYERPSAEKIVRAALLDPSKRYPLHSGPGRVGRHTTRSDATEFLGIMIGLWDLCTSGNAIWLHRHAVSRLDTLFPTETDLDGDYARGAYPADVRGGVVQY